jgi:hypothetical protein
MIHTPLPNDRKTFTQSDRYLFKQGKTKINPKPKTRRKKQKAHTTPKNKNSTHHKQHNTNDNNTIQQPKTDPICGNWSTTAPPMHSAKCNCCAYAT